MKSAMNRRKFCQATLGVALGAGLAGRAWPGVYAGMLKVDRDIDAVTSNGKEINLGQASVQALADALRGPLLLPGNAAYDSARLVLNPTIDKYPPLIVQPTGAADVSTAVEFASANKLVVAVKCGGHSTSGKSTCNGGMMIDLSAFRDVRIDATKQSAYVTGGSLVGQMDHESMARGLVTTAGTVSHTGVGGLTTGGGFGRLARRYGLTLDNVIGAEVVTADGTIRQVSADKEPDLLWAIRGGGGNFGVVTSFEFRLHPMQREVMGGALVFPMNRARELLEVYAEYSPIAADEFYVDLIVMPPAGERPGMAMVGICHSGSATDAGKALRPYRRIGKSLRDTIKPVDYVALQRSSDSSDPRARASYLKGGFVSEITPGLIDDLSGGLEGDPNRSTMAYFQHAGGAIGRIAADATAFPHRYVSHNMMCMLGWDPSQDGSQHVSWLKDYWKRITPHTHGFYVNDSGEVTTDAVNLNYLDNYPRLAEIKKRYDPDNLFRLNANITPAA